MRVLVPVRLVVDKASVVASTQAKHITTTLLTPQVLGILRHAIVDSQCTHRAECMWQENARHTKHPAEDLRLSKAAAVGNYLLVPCASHVLELKAHALLVLLEMMLMLMLMSWYKLIAHLFGEDSDRL